MKLKTIFIAAVLLLAGLTVTVGTDYYTDLNFAAIGAEEAPDLNFASNASYQEAPELNFASNASFQDVPDLNFAAVSGSEQIESNASF